MTVILDKLYVHSHIRFSISNAPATQAGTMSKLPSVLFF